MVDTDNDLRIKHYCELYTIFINSCLQTNKEVFGFENPEMCVKYIEPYNKLCK